MLHRYEELELLEQLRAIVHAINVVHDPAGQCTDCDGFAVRVLVDSLVDMGFRSTVQLGSELLYVMKRYEEELGMCTGKICRVERLDTILYQRIIGVTEYE